MVIIFELISHVLNFTLWNLVALTCLIEQTLLCHQTEDETKASVTAYEALEKDLLTRLEYESNGVWEDEEWRFFFNTLELVEEDFDFAALAHECMLIKWWVEVAAFIC